MLLAVSPRSGCMIVCMCPSELLLVVAPHSGSLCACMYNVCMCVPELVVCRSCYSTLRLFECMEIHVHSTLAKAEVGRKER